VPFPNIDPILFQIGPVAIHWYGVAYAVGIILGLLLARRFALRYPEFRVNPIYLEDFSVWVILGILIGGRLGSVLFYNLDYYLANPIEILKTWKGGMAFHGGLLGVVVAAAWFCKRKGIRFLDLSDLIACTAPIGLLFGRLANFINAELWGRPTDLPWGIVFPTADDAPRHPSQLYEAALEGAFLFVLLIVLLRQPFIRHKRGLLTGVFLLGYGVLRTAVEFTREPDASLIGPMVVIGGLLIFMAFRPKSRREPANPDASGGGDR
jgi:phosphatidylglycerol---prolipoprotein diacylglyceryl transferase